MTRVQVVENDVVVGHFDRDAVQGWWSDQDPITGDGGQGAGRGQAVILTAQGRWVLEAWTNWAGETDQYEFITPERARAWLLRNAFDDVVEQHFGPIEPERGPGRPEVGPRIGVRLPEELLEQLDTYADQAGINRAEAVRQMVAAGLSVQTPTGCQ